MSNSNFQATNIKLNTKFGIAHSAGLTCWEAGYEKKKEEREKAERLRLEKIRKEKEQKLKEEKFDEICAKRIETKNLNENVTKIDH